ncbi:putative nucleotidyltransferase component of viral defense system [Actinopolymorpha cephalotaxi]|uniref:Nucleotidyltransferase component of viral defense system n=1 Tax=Actinopolymorpha cephalotaxi TaxID=504797 RepID=A0ABX2RX15_9ACTN|nr:putative nucleotidyltransferase component of viral defense system [Actinopolymorpha cephalotaxi]
MLGGGHAIELHHMGTRPSEDIDLFSTRRGSPGEVADEVMDSYRREGFEVVFRRRSDDLVQMQVIDAQGRTCMVDLGVFWRARSPVLMEIGPVLHPDDAAAGKMDALYNRWAPRDFLDVDAILASGRYSKEQLLSVAAEHNPGFSPAMFAQSLSYLHRVPDREFTAYVAGESRIAAMRARFTAWEKELQGKG